MRKVLISLLLASAAAAPALAERPRQSDNSQSAQEDRQQAREDRSSAREERSSAREEQSSSSYSRPDRGEQHNYAPRQQQNVERQVQAFERRQQVNGGTVERNATVERSAEAYRARRQAVQGERSVEAYRARQQAVQGERQDRVQERAARLQQMSDTREARQAARFDRAPAVSDTPRPGTQPPLRVEQNHAPIQWSSNWRNNNKYDWKNYRHHHRSHFHLGFYYDPFGWGYSPFQIGWRMWPNYYRSSYWLNDPWSYRLPYAPPGTRWIRYYDDAILVDIWSGQVIDVIYDFFW